jgi:hypothetical protein
MGALVEKDAEMPRDIGDRIGIGDANGIEAKRARFVGERCLQIGRRELDGRVQKSRST